jgi:cysteine-rich repeat protein
MHRLAPIVALAAACSLAACGMSSANPRYCDGTTPCKDPQWPVCDVVAHQCNESPDGGLPHDASVPGDGGTPEAGTPADGPTQVDGGTDAGCTGCTGETPACSGTTCVCTSTSCATAHPICDTAGTCRTCATHAECAQRDPLTPVCATAGTCGSAVCGDTVVSTTAGERCDYGDTQNYDGCDPTCRYTGTVTTIAGKAGNRGYCDAPGGNARLFQPGQLVAVGTTIYFSDQQAHTIRRTSYPTYTVSTLAGSYKQPGSTDGVGAAARFSYPEGLAYLSPYLYVSDSGNHTIRRIHSSTGATETIAGAAGQSGTADGPGATARFNKPYGLAIYGTTLYVADGSNCAIRKIALGTTGFPVSTFVGSPGTCGHVDGNGAAARLAGPAGIAALSADELYFTDGQGVRRAQVNGDVTSPYGAWIEYGWVDATGTAARFFGPGAMAYLASPTPTLYVAEAGNYIVRKIDLNSGSVTTLAGTAGQIGNVDGTGAAARFTAPKGLGASWSSSTGAEVYVTDFVAGTMRHIVASTGQVTTVAGAASNSGTVDGTGSDVRFTAPAGMVPNGSSLLVGDSGSYAIRAVSPATGAVTTVAGSVGFPGLVDDVGTAARFLGPRAFAAAGDVFYVGDKYAVREYNPATGSVVTRAGGVDPAVVDADGLAARFKLINAVVPHGDYVYVGDSCCIRRMTKAAPWTVTTVIGDATACDSTDGNGTYARVGTTLSFALVGDLLYITDQSNHTLRRVDLSNNTFHVETVAGDSGVASAVDGIGLSARFDLPKDLAYDGQSLFVVDRNQIRQVDPVTMSVTTLFGRSGCLGALDGDYAHGAIGYSSANIAYHPGTGFLYLAENGENTIREVR